MCERAAEFGAARAQGEQFIVFKLCDEHALLVTNNGWMVGPLEEKVGVCAFDELLVAWPDAEHYVTKTIPPAVKKKGGRPKGYRPPPKSKKSAVIVDPLEFRCDRWPNLKIVIPEWRDEGLLEDSVHFRGSILHLGGHGLTPEQIEQAEKILLNIGWVYRENPRNGECIRCPCGQTFPKGHDMRLHEHYAHGEAFNAVMPNTPGIGGIKD